MPRRKPNSGKAQKSMLQAKRAAKRTGGKQAQKMQAQEKQADGSRVLTASITKTGLVNGLSSAYVLDQSRDARLADIEVPLDLTARSRPLLAFDADCAAAGLPLRPPWREGTSAADLEASEARYFAAWVDSVHARYAATLETPLITTLTLLALTLLYQALDTGP